MEQPRLFEATTEGTRRSVLFAVGLGTGFVCLVAATSAYLLSAANLPISVGLAAAGFVALSFALLTYAGRFPSLVTDDQFLWQDSE